MKTAILTYNIPHRKTQDLLFRLLIKGYKPTIIVSDWQNRKQHKPLFVHRPPNPAYPYPHELAETFKCDIQFISNYSEIGSYDYILVGGAGIIKPLPESPVINAHPGYLPYARGLDALKWSIYHGVTTGITVHKIDEQTDRGDILYREEIKPKDGEQFYEFAMRIYEREIDALVEHFTDSPIELGNSYYEAMLPKVMGRMPARTELQMIKIYETTMDRD